jgi:hypothetical protein
MQSNPTDSIINICKILNKHSVRYLIVGGSAVAFYGYQRQSKGPLDTVAEKPDIDIWYDPSYSNYFKLLDALEEWGEEVKRYRDEAIPDPYHSFFRFNYEYFTLDFLPVIEGLSKFKISYENGCVVKNAETELFIISIEDLIKSKAYQGRPKDLEDIEQLKKNSDKNKKG